jgi:hypothetical protein
MVNTFEGLLGVLVGNQVRFTLVGGLAVSLNGFIRTTEDMDILVDDHPLNLRNLLNCLLQFGEGYAGELGPSDFSDEEGAIRVREDFDLDIFVRMRGIKYQDMTGHIRHYVMADGTKIPYLDADGLILLKKGSVREKDLIDVAALTRIGREAMRPGNEAAELSLDQLRENSPSEPEASPGQGDEA